MLTSTLYACVLLAALFFSMVRGSEGERQIGLVLLCGNSATIVTLYLSHGHDFTFVSATYLAVDVACALILCALAVLRPSWMAILIAAFQINGTLGHAVKLLAPETIELSYAILLRLWGWPMALTLLVAHWYPRLNRLLRQSDLAALPPLVRPRTIKADWTGRAKNILTPRSPTSFLFDDALGSKTEEIRSGDQRSSMASVRAASAERGGETSKA